MKKPIMLIALLGLLATPVVQTGCKTVPSERVAVVQTLLVAGHAAESAVSLSAQLYRDGKITAEQSRQVIDFYNQKWQPAYQLAVVAAQGDLNGYASPDVWILLTQLSSLVTSYTNHPTP